MAARPHILFINTDQLRADFLGCYGFAADTSPNFDRLAAEGVRFTAAVTQCPLCTPARYSLTTGRYVAQHGARTNNHAVYPTVPSMVSAFGEGGYRTVAVGKLHHNPPDQKFGFDEVYLHDGTFRSRRPYSVYSKWLEEQGIDEDDLALAADVDDDPEKRRLKGTTHWGPCRLPDRYCESTFLADLAIDIVNEHEADKPLMLYLSFVAPHSPYCPPPPYDKLFDPSDMPAPPRETGEQLARKHRAIAGQASRFGEGGITDEVMRGTRSQYAGLLRHLDEHAGRAIDAFRKRFGDDIIICLTSDHGDFLGEHNKYEKHWLYEAAVRVPWIVTAPGRVPKGITADAPVEQIDMFPTVLGLAGVTHEVTDIDGVDRSEELTSGEIAGSPYVFSECWATIGPGAAYTAMARSRTHKLIAFVDEDPSRETVWEFYDLEADPHELDNIAERPDAAETLAAHRAALTEWFLTRHRHDPPPGFTA